MTHGNHRFQKLKGSQMLERARKLGFRNVVVISSSIVRIGKILMDEKDFTGPVLPNFMSTPNSVRLEYPQIGLALEWNISDKMGLKMDSFTSKNADEKQLAIQAKVAVELDTFNKSTGSTVTGEALDRPSP